MGCYTPNDNDMLTGIRDCSSSNIDKNVNFKKELIEYNLVCIFRNDNIESQKNSRCLGGGTGRRKGLKKQFDSQ